MSNDISAAFRTSLLGRFAHGFFGLVFGAFTAAGVWALSRGVGLDGGPLLSVAVVAVVIGAAWFAIYCFGFTVKRGERVICTTERLIYRGLTETVSIPWASVSEMWLDFGGSSPFVHMGLRAKPMRWRPYWLNLSGLTPAYPAVVALVRSKLPHAKVWLPPRYDQAMQPDSNVPLALQETAIDDALTVVRADSPQASRRSTSR